jgi:hypothetical protein
MTIPQWIISFRPKMPPQIAATRHPTMHPISYIDTMVEIVSVSVAYQKRQLQSVFCYKPSTLTFNLIAFRKYGVDMMLPMIP